MCIKSFYTMFCGILTGKNALVAEPAVPSSPAHIDGAVSDSPHAPQTCTDANFDDGLHDLGGFVPREQLFSTR